VDSIYSELVNLIKQRDLPTLTFIDNNEN